MITERHVRILAARYGGRARSVAYLEFAQEHLLRWMADEGLLAETFFKGGTAIRKFHLGLAGRFSTDLDFNVADPLVGQLVIDGLRRGVATHDVVLRLDRAVDDEEGRHAYWYLEAPELGRTMTAKLDFSDSPLLLDPEVRPRQPIPGVDDSLGFALAKPSLMDIRENVAEKLARLRRVVAARDLYDLWRLGDGLRAHLGLIREMVCFKVYGDVVEHGRGVGPFVGGREFLLRADVVFDMDDLGALTNDRLDATTIVRYVAEAYGAMGAPVSDTERRLAECGRNYRDREWARSAAQSFRDGHRGEPAR